MSEFAKLKRLERFEAELQMTWADGTENKIAYIDLRYWCPCAKCSPRRDSEDLASNLISEISSLRNAKPDVEKVGGYALHFEWSDGCNSGIYRFERLWDLALSKDPDGGKPFVHGAW
jgi:ATP-binding protein involved in chromosome partitioning